MSVAMHMPLAMLCSTSRCAKRALVCTCDRNHCEEHMGHGLWWFINEDGEVYSFHSIVQQKVEFPNDDHIPYSSQVHAEEAADAIRMDAEAHADKAAPELVSYQDALAYAIFAINALDERDPTARVKNDQVIETLEDLRDVVLGRA